MKVKLRVAVTSLFSPKTTKRMSPFSKISRMNSLTLVLTEVITVLVALDILNFGFNDVESITMIWLSH